MSKVCTSILTLFLLPKGGSGGSCWIEVSGEEDGGSRSIASSISSSAEGGSGSESRSSATKGDIYCVLLPFFFVLLGSYHH